MKYELDDDVDNNENTRTTNVDLNNIQDYILHVQNHFYNMDM